MVRVIGVLACFLALALPACSGANSNPVAPTPTATPPTTPTTSTPTVSSLALSGPTQVTVGQTVRWTATATMSDGSQRDMTAQSSWTSSNAQIAATASNGSVIGSARGSATITARSGDVSATATVTVTGIFAESVVIGPNVSATDADFVRRARAINEAFWGPLETTILAYATVPEVIAAYQAACRCTLSGQRLLELDAEAMTTVGGTLLVSVGGRSQFQSTWMERLTHSEFHAMQGGFTNGYLGPTWLVEGGAEYSQVHAMAQAGLVSLGQYHQFRADGARAYPESLQQWENWPQNPLAPDGCMATNSCSAPYALGHLAVDLLTVRLTRSSVLAFWRELGVNLRGGSGTDAAWRRAFATVFEISADDFYVAFEEYRRRGFR